MQASRRRDGVGRKISGRKIGRGHSPAFRLPAYLHSATFGADPRNRNPNRKRGNYRNLLPRLRFGLLEQAKVALSNH